MAAIGNVLWLVLFGWWMALAYALAGVVMFLLIITIPLGVQAFKLAGFVMWPFGRVVVDSPGSSAVVSTIANVIWILLAGWWLALAHLGAALVFFITIIGIPFAWANLKMAALALIPFGRTVVPDSMATGPVVVSVSPLGQG